MTEARTRKNSFRGRLPSGEMNAVDIHIGKRVRTRRMLMGLSQEDVASAIGVAFQQMQKYECAVNRISTARLWRLAQALHCPVSFFYEGIENSQGPRKITMEMPTSVESGDDLSVRHETLKLVRAYSTIRQPHMRRQILDLANSLGGPATPTAKVDATPY